MNNYEIWTLAQYGLFEETVFSPLFLITEIKNKRVEGHPVFFGDSLACEDDIKLELSFESYRNVWVDSRSIVIAASSCLEKVAELDDKTVAGFIRTFNGENILKRGRPLLGIDDPLSEMKNEMRDFFDLYSRRSLSETFGYIPEFVVNKMRSLLAFDVAELVTQQAAGGNRVESRVTEKNSLEINYSLERRIDQDGDLVISINGRANIKSGGTFRIWLVLVKDKTELFRKEIRIKDGHFEEYYYREELMEHSLNPENVMRQLEKGDLKCYLIVDSGIEE